MDRNDRVAEIVGGLDIQDLMENGSTLELKCIPPDDNDIKEEQEYERDLQNYLKLECLHTEGTYDGQEPFTILAEKMDTILPNGKIKKKIVRTGYGPHPENSTIVNVHYNAYLQFEAQPFDSTYARKKPFSFKVGEGEVIEGLDIAVRSMKINEKSQFVIDPELAYRGGSLGRVPPNALVLFEIELQDLHATNNENDPGVDQTFQSVYEICKALRVKGNGMVKLQDYIGAMNVYKKAVNKLEDAVLEDYNDQLKSEELLVGLYTNLLVCCSLSKNPKRGCLFAQKIYEMSKNETFKTNAKVYFNHAKCTKMLGDFDHTRRLLFKAKRLEPNNLQVIKEIEELQKATEQHKQHEKNLAKALVSS